MQVPEYNIQALPPKDFEKECGNYLNKIKHSHSYEEYHSITVEYEHFVTVYQKKHPRCNFRRAPRWEVVHPVEVHVENKVCFPSGVVHNYADHHHHEPHVVDHHEPHYEVVEVLVPEGDHSHGGQDFESAAEHFLFLDGGSESVTIHNFEYQLEHWVTKLEWSKTETEYHEIEKSIEKLISVYESHHIKVKKPKLTPWKVIKAAETGDLVIGKDIKKTTDNFKKEADHFKHKLHKKLQRAEFDKIIKKAKNLEKKAKKAGIKKPKVEVPTWEKCPCNSNHK